MKYVIDTKKLIKRLQEEADGNVDINKVLNEVCDRKVSDVEGEPSSEPLIIGGNQRSTLLLALGILDLLGSKEVVVSLDNTSIFLRGLAYAGISFYLYRDDKNLLLSFDILSGDDFISEAIFLERR